MTDDAPRYYVGRHWDQWAVYDVLHNNSPSLSVHPTEEQAQAAADQRNTPRRAARAQAQESLFDQEVAR